MPGEARGRRCRKGDKTTVRIKPSLTLPQTSNFRGTCCHQEANIIKKKRKNHPPPTRFLRCHVREGLGQLCATWESWGCGSSTEKRILAHSSVPTPGPPTPPASLLEGPLRMHQNNPSLLLHLPLCLGRLCPPAEGLHAAWCTG